MNSKVNNPGPEDPTLDFFQKGFIARSSLECLKCSKVPKMPKVNEFFVSFKIDLAKGEYLNFSSL
jgi:hypothetical protein